MLVKENLGPCPPYITLSHCWEKSGADGVKTTRANLHERKRCLSWEDLPKTFQDAVVVTRWLGIRHLWIDCLCIIQASEDEDIETGKERSEEISRMGDIYAGSFVTIASHFDSEEPRGISNDGLFLSNRCIREIILEDNDGKEFKTYVKEKGRHGLNQPRTLTGRAWCLQERLLSPRILHFRKWEVIFECFSHRCCECRPDEPRTTESPMAYSGHALYKELYPDTAIKCIVGEQLLHWEEVDGQSPDEQIKRSWRHWHHLVEEYTKATLTKPEDTLSALSGVVNSIPTGILGSYIAGLWSKNLPWELLWRPTSQDKPERHSVYVAPSFSWASMRTPVGYIAFHNSSKCQRAEVLQCTIRPISEKDPLGALEFGSIRLRARMVQAQFRRIDSDSRYLEIRAPLRLFRPYSVHDYADTYQDLERCTGSNVRLVEIATETPDQRRIETCLSTDGILVTESITYPDFFERIGFFTLRGIFGSNPRGSSYCCFDEAQATEFIIV